MDTGTKIVNWCSIIFGVMLGILTGYLIYNRTLTRSRELEAQERAPTRTAAAPRGEFSDEVDEETATATIIPDDQIDFLDGGILGPDRYEDEETDGEDDVFKYGDGDEEEAIVLDRQSPHR